MDIQAVIFDLNGVLIGNTSQRIFSSPATQETSEWVNKKLIETVEKLKEKNIKTAIITNISGSKSSLSVLFDKPIDDLFDAVIISSEVGVLKPNKKIYEIALDKLDIAPHQALFFDDRRNNVNSAKEMGIHAFFFKGTQGTVEKIEEFELI